jgi:50S ribosomal subunit-associated GTPase HflX
LPNLTTKVVLVTYPDSFRLEEAKSLVRSAEQTKSTTTTMTTIPAYQIIKTFTQKYLNRSKYGIGSGKAEEIKQFVRESKSEKIIIDEHLTLKQIHNLEKLTSVPVIDRERLAKRKRHLYQEQRLKTGMPVVSLLGYTSSGKTTLFNLLTNEHKETSKSLFTTLSTTTRSLKLDDRDDRGNRTILLTDTIGFISRLPTYMIDAFKSSQMYIRRITSR